MEGNTEENKQTNEPSIVTFSLGDENHPISPDDEVLICKFNSLGD